MALCIHQMKSSFCVVAARLLVLCWWLLSLSLDSVASHNILSTLNMVKRVPQRLIKDVATYDFQYGSVEEHPSNRSLLFCSNVSNNSESCSSPYVWNWFMFIDHLKYSTLQIYSTSRTDGNDINSFWFKHSGCSYIFWTFGYLATSQNHIYIYINIW